jgi:hypothetical protein
MTGLLEEPDVCFIHANAGCFLNTCCVIYTKWRNWMYVNMGSRTLQFRAVTHSKRQVLRKCSGCTCIASLPMRDAVMPKHDVLYEAWCDSVTVGGQWLYGHGISIWRGGWYAHHVWPGIWHETVAHCLYQDTLPLNEFQRGKHFLALIICLKEADICICSSSRMRNTDSHVNKGGR